MVGLIRSVTNTVKGEIRKFQVNRHEQKGAERLWRAGRAAQRGEDPCKACGNIGSSYCRDCPARPRYRTREWTGKTDTRVYRGKGRPKQKKSQKKQNRGRGRGR